MNFIVKTLPLAELVPDPDNARIHDRRNIEVIKKSLQTFQQYRDFVIRKKDHRIIIGNGMYIAMQELAWTEARCKIADLTDAEARALSIFDNRASDTSSFKESITEMLDMLDPSLLELCGYTQEELSEMKAMADENTSTYNAMIRSEQENIRFVFGKYSFTVSRSCYNEWLSSLSSELVEEEILKRLGVPVCRG